MLHKKYLADSVDIVKTMSSPNGFDDLADIRTLPGEKLAIIFNIKSNPCLIFNFQKKIKMFPAEIFFIKN